MSAINDGGPAFPMAGNTSNWDSEKGQYVPQYGMSLRDWFAGQALSGMSAHKDSAKWEMHEITADCYAYADAMLAARKGGSND